MNDATYLSSRVFYFGKICYACDVRSSGGEATASLHEQENVVAGGSVKFLVGTVVIGKDHPYGMSIKVTWPFQAMLLHEGEGRVRSTGVYEAVKESVAVLSDKEKELAGTANELAHEAASWKKRALAAEAAAARLDQALQEERKGKQLAKVELREDRDGDIIDPKGITFFGVGWKFVSVPLTKMPKFSKYMLTKATLSESFGTAGNLPVPETFTEPVKIIPVGDPCLKCNGSGKRFSDFHMTDVRCEDCCGKGSKP
jgi:hypothetical protein